MIDRAVFQKIFFLLVLISTLGIVSVLCQEQAPVREDLWVCPVFETSFYSLRNPAFGGGAALGYGNGVSFGLKVVYSNDLKGISTLELNLLLRLYLSGLFRSETKASSSGPFFQFTAGSVIVAQDSSIEVPSEMGTFSAGLSFGWRFLLGRFFFIEPTIRGGYPYIVGGGLSAGVRF